ncbi:glycosidase [Pseudomonas baetica]|nr:glycosidase [Pseudomonas baetica]
MDVERELAQFASWYELFPRSITDSPARHGTFNDVHSRLAMIQDMGFDVLYFPPIHPIGHSYRKGPNNSLTAGPDDPGSPYAIGSEEGGHEAIHSQLGTREDFRRLVAAAAAHGLEIALDFAIQCSQDHPWLKQHPGWFNWRPDGTIKYAENPAKEIPGHCQRRLLYPGGDSEPVAGTARHRGGLGRRGREDFSRR